jgi:hypothetical protein
VSEELTISGGDTTSVVTDELYSTAVQLELLTREASALRSSISAIDDVLTRSRIGDASRSALLAETDLDRAAMFLMQVEVQSRFFAFAVSSAADGYTAVELMARRLVGEPSTKWVVWLVPSHPRWHPLHSRASRGLPSPVTRGGTNS